jgi:hypothetical protein
MSTPASSGTDLAVPGAALTYVRNCYANALDWYKVADSKAQLIVTLNGIVVTVVTGTAFAKPDEMKSRLSGPTQIALVPLGLAAACVVCALVCAVICLFSRLDDGSLRALHRSLTGAEPYTLTPEVAWWFGMIASLTDGEGEERQTRVRDMSVFLMSADEAFETQALASQIVLLSQNTLAKHQWVNRGWLATVAGIIGIVLFGVFYMLGVLT